LLRQDPQVLVIGEIRDEETAKIAVRAALTGHLVISTLHAGSCKRVCQRLLSLCPEPSAVAAALEMIINQRLVRIFCHECGGKGCDACLRSGYMGRVPIAETVKITDPLRADIGSGEFNAIVAAPNLSAAADAAVKSGLTDNREIRRVLGLPGA
jgi:type II secretory ATPase GspE/PulE/Tfp pilus assembly ATPase PilB-like protein